MTQSEAEQFDLILRRSEKGFSQPEIEALSHYYRLVMKWNSRLHLTTITEPSEFFERHIVESAFAAEKILPSIKQVWDLGSGAGIPGLVIAIRYPAFETSLVEANHRKSLFLDEVIAELKLPNARVVRARFESLDQATKQACITVRAIEGMERLVSELLNFGEQASQMIFLGGERLEDQIRLHLDAEWTMENLLIPGSKRRYLVNAIRST